MSALKGKRTKRFVMLENYDIIDTLIVDRTLKRDSEYMKLSTSSDVSRLYKRVTLEWAQQSTLREGISTDWICLGVIIAEYETLEVTYD